MAQPFSLIITPPIDAGNSAFTSPLDLSAYLDVVQGDGMDPYDPRFTDKIFSHSLLKEGGTLALEDFKLKELVFPVVLTAANTTAMAALVQAVNNAIGTPGAVAAWKDAGASQPTYFDLAAGQLDIQYDYRRSTGAQSVLRAKLRLFSAPFGRAATSLPLTATTPAGPTTVVGASVPLIKFVGASLLAGDAPALLAATVNANNIPGGAGSAVTAMAVLPDAAYQAMLPLTLSGSASQGASPDAVGGTFIGVGGANSIGYIGSAPPYPASGPIPARYAGRHRILALARSQAATGMLSIVGSVVGLPNQAGGVFTPNVPVGQWALVDLGAINIVPGLAAQYQSMGLNAETGGGASAAVQVTGLFCLPEATSCLLNPAQVPLAAGMQAISPLIAFDGTSTGAYAVVDVGTNTDVSSSVRGTVPRPRPQSGPPVLAFLSSLIAPAGATSNPQNLAWLVAVNALARTKYILG